MRRIFVAIGIFLLAISIASAKEMADEEISKALAQVPALIDLEAVRADGYSDGSFWIILDYGQNKGVKISRYEIKDLEKYLTPKKRLISEPEPRIIEKIIKVPGPERIIEKQVKILTPGPTRFIVREALPVILIAGAFILSGRIAEDRYEKSLEPKITQKIQPGKASVLIEYQGKSWLRYASDASYAAGGIALSMPVFKRIF